MKVLNFNNLGLSKESLNAVSDMGYESPTQIQHESIPHILKGRDVIGHSKTGTGKTMAFGLPAIEIADATNPATQVLVLCPTRELAEQAAGEIRKASVYKKNIYVTAIYGRGLNARANEKPKARLSDSGRHTGTCDGPHEARHSCFISAKASGS